MELEGVEEVVGFVLGRTPAQAAQHAGPGNGLRDPELPKSKRTLGQVGHHPCEPAIGARAGRHRLAVQVHVARRRREQADELPHQRRLTGSVGPEDAEDLTDLRRERDSVVRDDFRGLVDLPEVPHLVGRSVPHSGPNPRRSRAWGRRCQSFSTRTRSPRNTRRPNSNSISSRASVPTPLMVAPCLPITIPFCESRSTKTVAWISRRPSSRSPYSSVTTAMEWGISSRIRSRSFSRTSSATNVGGGWSRRVPGGEYN